MILNNKDILLLEDKSFKNIKKKINHFKSNYNYVVENFDKNKHNKQHLIDFFEDWKNYAIKNRNKQKASSVNDINLISYIYSTENSIKGILLKVDNKIIGVCFYIFSTSKKYAISLTSKVNVKYIGSSEYLYYLSCKRQFCNDVNKQNIGNLPYGPINRFKNKFNGNIIKVYFVILKENNEIKDINYWIMDHISRY